MFRNLWKGLLDFISKPMYKKTTRISEDVTSEVEVSLKEVARKLEVVVHNLKEGPHEIVPEAQRFLVRSTCSRSDNPKHYLSLGDLIWKMKFSDGTENYYHACDISIRGEYFIRREEEHLNKEWIESEIAKTNIVSVGVIGRNIPVRIIKVCS